MTDLTAHDIDVVFARGDRAMHAVRSGSISVRRGEIVGLVGESGSGKTTLGRVLAGLHRPTSGRVAIGGKTIAASDLVMSRADHRRVQMIFQDPYSSLNPSLRGVEAVAEVLRVCRGTSRREAKSRALERLAEVGIGPDLANRLPRHLSGGQRQRVSIARALSAGPEFLVADEPTSAIDQSAQAQVLHLLDTLHRATPLGILFISHDLRVIGRIAARVYVMYQGEIVESGPTAEVLGRPRHEYTTSLIQAIPGRATDLGAWAERQTDIPYAEAPSG